MKSGFLKGTTLVSLITVAALVNLAPPPVQAGDSEWATVGKILTGVVGAGIIYEVIDGDHVSYSYNSYHSYGYRYPRSYYRGSYYRGRPYGYSRYYRHYPRRHHRYYGRYPGYYSRDRYFCYR